MAHFFSATKIFIKLHVSLNSWLSNFPALRFLASYQLTKVAKFIMRTWFITWLGGYKNNLLSSFLHLQGLPKEFHLWFSWRCVKFRLSWLNFYLEAQKNLQKSWLSNFPTRFFMKLQNLGSLNSWIRNFPTRFPPVAIFSNLIQFIQTSFYNVAGDSNKWAKNPWL